MPFMKLTSSHTTQGQTGPSGVASFFEQVLVSFLTDIMFIIIQTMHVYICGLYLWSKHYALNIYCTLGCNFAVDLMFSIPFLSTFLLSQIRKWVI